MLSELSLNRRLSNSPSPDPWRHGAATPAGTSAAAR